MNNELAASWLDDIKRDVLPHSDLYRKYPDQLSEALDLGSAALRRIAEDDKAREEGRLVELPLVAMVERSLQGGKMTTDRDQRFNGRYAVVYSGKGKWGCPLIDICGTPYNSDQAEDRKNELTRQEAEAALGGGEHV